MTKIEIKKLIEKKVACKGYKLEEIDSLSTESMYFKISSGNTSLTFRVSDHKTSRNLITLRVDHKTNRQLIENFIENRCKDLSKRRVKELLGL